MSGRPLGGKCAWAAVAALPLAATAAWLAVASEHVADPADTAAFHACSIALPMLAGALWCVRRPRHRIGPLLVLYGLVWWVISWQDADAPLPHTLGVFAEAPAYVLTFVLILAFPTGRLETRADRAVVALLCLVAALSIPVYLTHPFLAGGGVFAGCDTGCPSNPFYVGPPNAWQTSFEPVRTALVPGVAALVLLQSELFAGTALRRLLSVLAMRPSLTRWRGAVADALDDPSLRIGFWNPTVRRHVELDGTPLDEEGGRLWVAVEQGGEPAAAITCDAVLAEEPELLRAVSEATLVALQSESLGRELRESRARLVGAADAERRKLGRDLHDSAQQRLVALRMRMGESAEAAELDRALSELRALAGGLYPPLLSRYGVAAALEALARVSAIPVKIDEDVPVRFSDSVESTGYFCCLEALQNAGKHAGPAATATVRLVGSEAGLRFEIIDDGHGFDPEARVTGAGLRNLADRLEAAGGTLEIESAPGSGTRVTGFVPAASMLATT